LHLEAGSGRCVAREGKSQLGRDNRRQDNKRTPREKKNGRGRGPTIKTSQEIKSVARRLKKERGQRLE